MENDGTNFDRRRFLKTAAIAAAGPAVLGSSAAVTAWGRDSSTNGGPVDSSKPQEPTVMPRSARCCSGGNRMTPEDVVNGAIGPFDDYCDGYGNPCASGLGYISVLKLETGLVKTDMDPVLEEIVSYDRAESKGTYIGQINMITASSFIGLNGAVWGYHLAKAAKLADGSEKPILKGTRGDGKQIPIYSLDPLLDAGRRLFGEQDERRFPILPGAHVKCAVKSHTVKGPAVIWCALALAIAEDRDRDANLLIEDCGHYSKKEETQSSPSYVDRLKENIAASVIRCGDDNGVKYKEIFIGCRSADVPEEHVGCALACAPYIVLPKNAVPRGSAPEALLSITIDQWEAKVRYLQW
jgi:histidine decarboxylase